MKVVVAVDGSEHALAAAEFAKDLLKPDDQVALCTAGYKVGDIPKESATLPTAAVHADPTSDARTAVPEFAKQYNADLIVCGTRGRGLLKRAVLGSVSSGILNAVQDMAVLVVHGKMPKGVRAYQMCLDGSSHSSRAVEFLSKLLGPEDHVVLYYGITPPEMFVETQTEGLMDYHQQKNPRFEAELNERKAAAQITIDDARSFLTTACPTLPAGNITSHIEAVGDARDAAIDFADSHNIQTLVCGSHGYDSFARLVLGSFSTYLVQYAANHAVLVVK